MGFSLVKRPGRGRMCVESILVGLSLFAGFVASPTVPAALAEETGLAAGSLQAETRDAKAVRPAREYKLVYLDTRRPGNKQKALKLPPVPPGMSYTRGSFATGNEVGVFGVLLRSDGRLVGVGEEGLWLVDAFEARNPGKKVVDMSSGDPLFTDVVFSDGLLGSIDPEYDQCFREASYRRLPGQAARFLQYDVLLLDNGLVVGADFKCPVYSVGKDSIGAFSISTHRGFVAAAAVTWSRCLSKCPDSWRNQDDWDPKGIYDQNDVVEFAYMVRGDGRVSRMKMPYGWDGSHSGKEEVGAWDEPRSGPNDSRDLEWGVPKTAKGKRWVSLSEFATEVLVVLRSDSLLGYRGNLRQIRRMAQPPKPAAGLRYVDVGWWVGLGKLALLRSDGRLVIVDPGWQAVPSGKLRAADKPPGPRAPKGWRFLSLKDFYGSIEYAKYKNHHPGRNSGMHTVYAMGVIEKIRPGDRVASGIRAIQPSKTVHRGGVARLEVRVVSQANLKGGKVVVTGPNGKTLGRAVVASANGKVTVKVKTSSLKPGPIPHTLSVQYLGNSQTAKSGTARVDLTLTPN